MTTSWAICWTLMLLTASSGACHLLYKPSGEVGDARNEPIDSASTGAPDAAKCEDGEVKTDRFYAQSMRWIVAPSASSQAVGDVAPISGASGDGSALLLKFANMPFTSDRVRAAVLRLPHANKSNFCALPNSGCRSCDTQEASGQLEVRGLRTDWKPEQATWTFRVNEGDSWGAEGALAGVDISAVAGVATRVPTQATDINISGLQEFFSKRSAELALRVGPLRLNNVPDRAVKAVVPISSQDCDGSTQDLPSLEVVYCSQ